MPNGDEMIHDLEFEKLIEGKNDRELLEYVARKSYETKKDMAIMCIDIKQNHRRSLINRIALFILLAVMVSMGLFDERLLSILRMFGI